MILLTGGTGSLGKELQRLIPDIIAPPRHILDITTFEPISCMPVLLSVDLIVHCAAYTNVLKAEIEKELCYKTNVIGTRNLADLGIPMLYISTEYIFDGEKGNYSEEDHPNPKNFYALTKLLGEYESRRTKSVVLRSLFKSAPFKYPSAFSDQFTSGDYVSRIAPEIVTAIECFDRLPRTIHVGFGRKSIYDLASQTKKVTPIKIESVKGVILPRDTSLNTRLWERIKHDIRAA